MRVIVQKKYRTKNRKFSSTTLTITTIYWGEYVCKTRKARRGKKLFCFLLKIES